MGPIIGLVPTATLFTGPDPFKDQYVFVNNYPKRIQQNGGVPIGLVSVDGNLPPQALEVCQGFLLCGGGKLWPYHMQVISHAMARHKPLLGICLGMQAICTGTGGGPAPGVCRRGRRPVPNHEGRTLHV